MFSRTTPPAPGRLLRPEAGRTLPMDPGSPPRVTVAVEYDLPADPDRAAKVAALAGGDLTAKLVDECRALPAVARLDALSAELTAIRVREQAAAEKVRAAEAAQVLARTGAAPGLGAELLRVAAQLQAAQQEGQAAGKEAAAVRALVPSAWVDAAEAIRSQVGDAPNRHATGLRDGLQQATEAVTYPPTAAQLEVFVVATEAVDKFESRRNWILHEARKAVIGDAPAGVERNGDLFRLAGRAAA